jgi:hypothetical protein
MPMPRNDDEILKKYIPAQGPEGLKQVLEDLFDQSQQDTEFAGREHFIYYKLGDQESLFKVDMSEKPVLIWYFDLLGRPATNKIREIISDFLWEKCGEKERYFISKFHHEVPKE